MRILGIDPGTLVVGYGIIETANDELTLVGFSSLTPPACAPIPQRLAYIYKGLVEVIELYQPDEVAVESPFADKNIKSALAIGKAQAVALLAAANHSLPVTEYSPACIKSRVAGSGNASKEQIQEMVRLLLNLAEIPQPNDAADALAVAICHHSERAFTNIISQGDLT
ncbi:MAG: crossover junction endodeoxyribonuclease RuvC [Dehalococcoides mccartyi]